MKQMTEDSLLCPHLLEPREAVWFAVGGVPSVGDVLSIGEAAGVMVGGGIVGVQGAVPRAQGPPLQRDHGVLAGGHRWRYDQEAQVRRLL
jgi:hypothetical protein